MANWTDEQFLADLERDFPGFDWDSVPDSDALPDVYVIDAVKWEQCCDDWKTKEIAEAKKTSISKWAEVDKRSVSMMEKDSVWYVSFKMAQHFQIEQEFNTIEEVNEQIDKMKKWENIIEHTIKTSTRKPEKAVWMSFLKDCRKEILDGQKVFPMYLP